MSRRTAETLTRPARRDLKPIVAQISAALASSLVLEEVLALIARRIAEAMDVWGCHILMYDARENTLTGVGYWAREISGEDAEETGAVIDLDERRDYLAVVKDRRMLETHVDDPGTAPEERAAMERWGEKSALEAPLVFGDEVIGVLSLLERRCVHRFTPEEKELLADLAVPAAIAIHNARLYTEQQERNRHLASLLESSRAMSSTVVLEEVLDLVARKAGEALESDECVIWEYDKENDALVFRSFFSRDTGGPGQELVGSISSLDEYPGDRKLLEERSSRRGDDQWLHARRDVARLDGTVRREDHASTCRWPSTTSRWACSVSSRPSRNATSPRRRRRWRPASANRRRPPSRTPSSTGGRRCAAAAWSGFSRRAAP